MLVKNKDKFYKYLFIYKHLKFIKFETNIKDQELKIVINALNIKSRYKRIKYIVNEGCRFIDQYYSKCNLCHFKNNICIYYRISNKNYINGCCRKCRYQSNVGCTTKNVACKLFNCSYVDYNGVEKLKFEDVTLFKLLNHYQRYVLKNDYFSSVKTVTIDLYVGPMCLLIRLIIRVIEWVAI